MPHIAVIGAGPIGTEFAAHAAQRGYDVTLIERGRVGENVARWGHVRLFSPWSMNRSALGAELLDRVGVEAPADDEFPTGDEYLDRYLRPLARALTDVRSAKVAGNGRVELVEQTALVAAGREGYLKSEGIMADARASSPFTLLLRDAETGSERTISADAVVDATGTFGNPRSLGDGGIPVPGEAAAGARVRYDLPDVLGRDRDEYAGRRTLVIGGGYSAVTTLRDLLSLRSEEPDTTVRWLVREEAAPYARIPDDPLPQRDALAALGNRIAGGDLDIEPLLAGRVVALEPSADAITVRVTSEGRERTIDVDRVVANIGYRPDPGPFRELQVHLCWATEGPMKLAAALLASSGGDCLEQTSQGPEVLVNPEERFFVIGSKSYGRRSDFLIGLGIDQVGEVLGLLDRSFDVGRRGTA